MGFLKYKMTNRQREQQQLRQIFHQQISNILLQLIGRGLQPEYVEMYQNPRNYTILEIPVEIVDHITLQVGTQITAKRRQWGRFFGPIIQSFSNNNGLLNKSLAGMSPVEYAVAIVVFRAHHYPKLFVFDQRENKMVFSAEMRTPSHFPIPVSQFIQQYQRRFRQQINNGSLYQPLLFGLDSYPFAFVNPELFSRFLLSLSSQR